MRCRYDTQSARSGNLWLVPQDTSDCARKSPMALAIPLGSAHAIDCLAEPKEFTHHSWCHFVIRADVLVYEFNLIRRKLVPRLAEHRFELSPNLDRNSRDIFAARGFVNIFRLAR